MRIIMPYGVPRVADGSNSPTRSTGAEQADCVDGVVIRTATSADLDVLRDIYRRASLSNEGDRPFLLANEEFLDFAGDGLADGRTRVAVVNGGVVGFITTSDAPGAFELDDLFVDPDWMRRGIAHALVADIVDLARRRDVPRITVTANDHALAFYERAGFVVDGMAETHFRASPRMHLDVTR